MYLLKIMEHVGVNLTKRKIFACLYPQNTDESKFLKI